MIKVPVYSLDGEPVGEEVFEQDYLNTPVNQELIYYLVVAYRSNQRQGTVGTKTRGMVSGGGRKPWRQKGTGRARVGSIRNPIWRHGGVVFGPKMRDYCIRLPKKEKKMALREALKDKILENRIGILQVETLPEAKTAVVSRFLKKLKFDGQRVGLVLSSDSKLRNGLLQAARNLAKLECYPAEKINAYDVLYSDILIIQKEALPVIRGYLGEKNA